MPCSAPLIPALLALLALPAVASAAPKSKSISGKEPATKPQVQFDWTRKRAINPCADITFTPEPLVVEGLYARYHAGPDAPLYLRVNLSAIGTGLIVSGHLGKASESATPKAGINAFHRLDTLPVKGRCKAVAGQAPHTMIRLGDPEHPDLEGQPLVQEARCEDGPTPRCELTFAPITIKMEPRPAGCGLTEGKFPAQLKTVVARPVDTNAGQSATIELRYEDRHVATGIEPVGVLLARPQPGQHMVKKVARRVYQAVFPVESYVSPSAVRTLFPGCASAELAPTDDVLRYPVATNDADVDMRSPIPTDSSFQFVECSWHGKGVDRVLACHVQIRAKTIKLAEELF